MIATVRRKVTVLEKKRLYFFQTSSNCYARLVSFIQIMETITIQVKPEIAQAYQKLNPEKKAKIEALLELLINQELNLPYSDQFCAGVQ